MKFLLSSLEVKSISLRFLINSFYFLILSWREIEFDLKNAFCDQNMTALGRLGKWMRPQEYMFLLAGNIMPGTEKLWGELLFPEEKRLFFSTVGRKNSFSKGNKCSSQSFFVPGIMFFSLKDTFSWGFILWPTINLYILIGSVLYCPYKFLLITWPVGRPPVERRGVQGGDPPAKKLRLLLKYCKKKATSALLLWLLLKYLKQISQAVLSVDLLSKQTTSR